MRSIPEREGRTDIGPAKVKHGIKAELETEDVAFLGIKADTRIVITVNVAAKLGHHHPKIAREVDGAVPFVIPAIAVASAREAKVQDPYGRPVGDVA